MRADLEPLLNTQTGPWTVKISSSCGNSELKQYSFEVQYYRQGINKPMLIYSFENEALSSGKMNLISGSNPASSISSGSSQEK